MDWTDFLSAMALVLILEGMMPFANPGWMRKMMASLSQLEDGPLRSAGLISMIAGLLLLYFARFS
jgi:uncharacterized protein YjeT (DUF2065 family)